MVNFLRTGKQYTVVWYGDDDGYERIDLMKDLSEYNFIDTSSCVSSYYRSSKELFYGDSELILELLKTKRTAVMFHGSVKQTTEFIDGKVRITTSKEDEALGVGYSLITENGLLVHEEYRTSSCNICMSYYNRDAGKNVPPVNISFYQAVNLIDGSLMQQDDVCDWYSLDYLKAKYKLDHIEDNDFSVVQTYEEAVRRLTRWKNAHTKVKAIDLETTGLGWSVFGDDVLVGVVLSYDTDESTYYPFRQENFDYNLPLEFLQEILDAVNNQPDDVVIVGHNAKVEIQGFWKEDRYYVGNSEYAVQYAKDHNITFPGLKDPMLRIDADSFILSILVNPVFRRGLHALKSLTYRIENKFYLELSDVFKNPKSIRFNVLPPEIVRYYACPDTANTIKVYKYLLLKLPKDELGIFQLENRMLYITANNEFYGMRTDREKLVRALENEGYITDQLKRRFQEIHRTTKNINSNDVRRDIFYNKLRCPVEVRTNTGKPSTSNIALKRIVELGTLRDYDIAKAPPAIVDMNKNVVVSGKEMISNRFPSLVILQKYAKHTKELGAFKRIERKSIRGRVFFNLNQAGAATGRQTSDAHQYSDGMKELILPDSKYHRLWSADFKQIELRILAYLAQQKDLIAMESDMDIDIHRAILSIINGLNVWEISAKMRKEGKSTNFGVVYMMSEFGLAKKNAGPAYTKDDLAKARDSILGFYNGLPAIKKFVQGNEDFVREHGYMKTLFGRYRYFKEILDPTYPESKKTSMVRAANNTPVQGFGADYLKIVEVTINDYIKRKGWDKKVDCDGVMLPLVRIMLPIHDEVLVSSHETIPHEEIIVMFKECMEQHIEGAPPFFSAPAMIDNWYLGKKDAYEIDLRIRDRVVDLWQREHKRIIHVGSYCDRHSGDDIRRIKKQCRKLREIYLTQDDMQSEGAYHLSESTYEKVYKSLSSEEYSELEECFLSDRDSALSGSAKSYAVIQRALDSSYNHYLEDLNAFRTARLKEYMDGLICKYRTVDEVATHVTHPELTHTLISVYVKSGEKFEHHEAIHKAVERYMEGTSIDVDRVAVVGKEEDYSTKEEILADDMTLREFMEFDENGEVINEETSSEEDADDLSTLTNCSSLERSNPVEKTYAMYMMDEVVIDLTEFTLGLGAAACEDPTAEMVNQKVAALSKTDSWYRVVYFVDKKLLRTNLKIDYCPNVIDAIVKECKELNGLE